MSPTSFLILLCTLAITGCAARTKSNSTASNSEPAAARDLRPVATETQERVPGTNHWIMHRNFSPAQIQALRAAIARLKFPQPAGTVDRLLPVRDALCGTG